MLTDEDLLAGAKDENISEIDERALLSDDRDVKRDSKDESIDDGDDLYDAAIEPSGQSEKREPADNSNVSTSAVLTGPAPTSTNSSTSISSGPSRRFQLYVGNLTWWTTDEDIMKVIESYGVTDVLDIKFAENRQNGQSRGYATVTTGSEASGKVIMDRLPGRLLQGNLVSVLPFGKHSLQRLEDATKSSGLIDKKEEKSNIPNLGTVRIGPGGSMMNINRMPMQMGPMNGMNSMGGMMGMGFNAQMGPNLMQMRPTNMMPQGQMMGGPPQINRPPPSFAGQPHNNMNTAQTMNSLLRNHQSNNLMPPGTGMMPPGTHVNPQVYPYFGQQKMDGFRSEISPAEFEEIMSRNKTVSSSAITRAMNDAAAGDVSSAIGTLNTAISLIRQSKIASDESCRNMIRTLEDALASVENKDHGSRKHRRRSHSGSPRRRSRSRERSSKESRSHRHSSHKRSRAY